MGSYFIYLSVENWTMKLTHKMTQYQFKAFTFKWHAH